MTHSHEIDLGFVSSPLPIGTHICQIYHDDDERNNSLLQFLAAGVKAEEKNACFSEAVTMEMIGHFFNMQGISLDNAVEQKALSLSRTSEVYFKNQKFDPDIMLNLLEGFYSSSKKEGFTAARVIGEMSPMIDTVPGGSRLLEYESRVTQLLRNCPITTVCQYNAHDFDGATIMDVLKVHPMMVVRGSVVNNPFFIPPEEYLKQ